MKKKKGIEDFSLDELIIVRNYISSYANTERVSMNMDSIIEKKRKETDFNHRLTIELMEQLHLFDGELLELLKLHGIKNIQDLIDSDLSDWDLLTDKRNILEEAKVWYDFSRIEKRKKK